MKYSSLRVCGENMGERVDSSISVCLENGDWICVCAGHIVMKQFQGHSIGMCWSVDSCYHSKIP